MDKKTIEEKINRIFETNGLYSDDDLKENELLRTIDSLNFISLIVEIESEFNIGIPDDLLFLSNFQTKEQIIEIVYKLINDIH